MISLPNSTTFWNQYDVAIYKNQDLRTAKWFLVEDPFPPFMILISYLTFCAFHKKIASFLPKYDLKYVMMMYNFFLVTLSMYMAYEFFMSSYLAGYSLTCQPVDYTESKLALRMASVCWWYFISKYIELLDTVFFVLRKKFNQISFLHVYHHSTMLIWWWLGIKYIAGGQSFFLALLNSSVHVVMYLYYFLSAFGPKMQKYLWWKKYITKLQLTQFFAISVHTCINLWVPCNFPKEFDYMVFVYMITLIILFSNFYIQSYTKKDKHIVNKKTN